MAPVTNQPLRGAPPTVEPYDFRRPMTLAREYSRAIEMASETFARQWGTLLTSRLRVVTGVQLDSVHMVSYDDYIGSLPDPTLMVVAKLKDSHAPLVVQVPLDLSLLWIDLMLAGPGLHGAVTEREHTEIETELLTKVLEMALGDLRYAFASVAPLDASISQLQYSPQFAQLVPAAEPVVRISYTVALDGHEWRATVMTPAEHLIDALRVAESSGRGRSESDDVREARRRVNEQIHEVPLEVAVRLRSLPIRPRELVELAVGDLVMLTHPSSRPLDVVVDDKVLAHAVVGANGRQLACQVVNFEENER